MKSTRDDGVVSSQFENGLAAGSSPAQVATSRCHVPGTSTSSQFSARRRRRPSSLARQLGEVRAALGLLTGASSTQMT